MYFLIYTMLIRLLYNSGNSMFQVIILFHNSGNSIYMLIYLLNNSGNNNEVYLKKKYTSNLSIMHVPFNSNLVVISPTLVIHI